MKKIIIVGGGISGLAATHRLIELSRNQGLSVQIALLEASSRFGGIINTEHRDGFLIEHGPDSFISEKPEAISLAKRLGIESHLIETNSQFRRSFIVRDGKLRAVPEGFQLMAPSRIWPFITTDIFSVSGKIRMAADLFLPRHNTHDESLASFVRRRLGQEALERMAQPMVGGIYTADPDKLSLRATLPRFLDMEREHRSLILAMMRNANGNPPAQRGVSGARYSLFLSFAEGVQVLTDSLVENIADCELPIADCSQVRTKLNTHVESIARKGNEWVVRTDDGQEVQAHGVCLAVPSYIAAKLLRDVDSSLATQLEQIQFASTATVNLAYRRDDVAHSLDGFGFVVPFVEKLSLIACTFSSVKFPGRAPRGHVLLRAFVGGALQPEMFALDEDQMILRVKSDLRELLGIQGEPVFSQVTKWANSMPQYEVGHLERMRLIEKGVEQLPGLVLAGNSYRGAGIPDCVRSGEQAAEQMLAKSMSH